MEQFLVKVCCYMRQHEVFLGSWRFSGKWVQGCQVFTAKPSQNLPVKTSPKLLNVRNVLLKTHCKDSELCSTGLWSQTVACVNQIKLLQSSYSVYDSWERRHLSHEWAWFSRHQRTHPRRLRDRTHLGHAHTVGELNKPTLVLWETASLSFLTYNKKQSNV